MKKTHLKDLALILVILLLFFLLIHLLPFSRKSSPDKLPPQIEESNERKVELKRKLDIEFSRAAEQTRRAPPPVQEEGWVSPDAGEGINTSSDPRMP